MFIYINNEKNKRTRLNIRVKNQPLVNELVIYKNILIAKREDKTIVQDLRKLH